MNPDWADAFRPSRIATPEGQFGSNGEFRASVKQSRLGFKANGEDGGKLWEGKFAFDMFGVGADAGKTAIRLRHAYGSRGPVLGGQTNSLFMDGDIFRTSSTVGARLAWCSCARRRCDSPSMTRAG